MRVRLLAIGSIAPTKVCPLPFTYQVSSSNYNTGTSVPFILLGAVQTLKKLFVAQNEFVSNMLQIRCSPLGKYHIQFIYFAACFFVWLLFEGDVFFVFFWGGGEGGSTQASTMAG